MDESQKYPELKKLDKTEYILCNSFILNSRKYKPNQYSQKVDSSLPRDVKVARDGRE